MPTSFKRDLLVHEAHTHPYIERLGATYLLRLRDRESFGSVSGAAWRSLFVCGLMPWIVKHRVNNSEDTPVLDDQSIMQDTSRRRGSALYGMGHSYQRAGRGSMRDSLRSSRRTSYLPSDEALQATRRESMMATQEDLFRSTISI